MHITKIIETGIDIQNTINLYVDDNIIKNIIIDKYKGRCIRGCWIRDITRIIKTGECIINQDGNPDFGTISVIFEVSAVIYSPGEIINGCIVVNNDKLGNIVCKTDIANIIVKPHKMLESIVKDQIIPLRVAASKYNTNTYKIAISAVPFIFVTQLQVFKFGTIPSQNELYTNILLQIEYEEAERDKLQKDNPKAWNTFNSLFYPYNEMQKQPPNIKVLNIKELLQNNKAPAYISRDNRIYPSDPYIYAYDIAPANANIIDTLPQNVLLYMLEDYCAGLRNIRENINIYNTAQITANHKNLWQIFKNIKL